MLSYPAVLKIIDEAVFTPVYLFYGEEKYLQEELVAHLTASFLGSEAEFGREKIEGSALSLQDIISKLSETGLFASRRLLIVDNPPYLVPAIKNDENDPEEGRPGHKFAEKDDAELLESYLEQLGSALPENILVFMAPRVDRRRRFYKIIDKIGVAVECSPLKGEALADWIRKKAASLNKKIERLALERLLWAGEQNLYYLSGELEKYSVYLGDDQEIITADVVDQLFTGDIQGDIFKLADAVAGGRLVKAQDLLELLLRRREKPLQIFFMLVRHYRLLLQAHCLLKEGIPPADFAAALEVHPFAARKLREQAENCSGTVLEDVIIALQETDLQIKTGRIEPAQALRLILSRIDFLQSTAGSSAS